MLLNVIIKKENLGWHFLLLACLAIYYSQERLLHTDCSNFLFHILNFKTFCFPEYRIGAFFTQLPLVVAVYLNLSVTILVPLFSLSFVLVYLLAFWICLKPLRNFPAALTILLSLVMGMAETYFHPVTETHQAMVYTALLYAWVSHKTNTRQWIKHSVTLLLVTWCALTHPISVFSVSFVLVYYLISSGNFQKWSAYLPLAFTALVYTIRVMVTDSGYDADQYNNLKNFSAAIPGFFNLQAVSFIIDKSSQIYMIPLVLFLYNNIMLIARKKTLLLLLHFGGILGFTLISIFTFTGGYSAGMVEKSFLPAVFMIIFTFSMIGFGNDQQNAGAVLAGHIAIAYALSFIMATGKIYAEKLDYYRSIIAYQHRINEPKMVVTRNNLNPGYLFNEWSMPIDMMVLSKLKGDTIAYTTYLTNDLVSIKEMAADPILYLHLSSWPCININELNRTYFNVPYGRYYILPENIKL